MEFQSTLALTQVRKADTIFHRRNDNVRYLNDKLSPLSDVLRLPYYSKGVSYLAYPLVIKNPKVISRLYLRRELESRGIETRPLFGCIPLQQPAYSFLAKRYAGKLPNAEYVGANGFYIGCHQYLSKSDLDFIVSVFKRVLKGK
jgi:CDP-6-deoxy-D-xylo-4-hexulose-3-dehydrase